MAKPYKIILCFLFLAAISLRFLLFWTNPPDNVFDNHFEPIDYIIQQGAISPKDACWQCYQPPLFYVVSAQVGKVLLNFGVTSFQFKKSLQFITSFFGIANLIIIYLILKRMPVSDFARLLTFAMVSFLPVHIYMSALHSNDTISYFFTSFCVYLALVSIDKKFSFLSLLPLSICISFTLLTKHTAFIVLPAIGAIFLTAYIQLAESSLKKIITSLVTVFLLPTIILGWIIYSDIKHFGKPFPTNIDFFPEKIIKQIPGGDISFATFKPWEVIRTPLLTRENVKSFWTTIYGRMWYDMEPKFILFTEKDITLRKSYYNYLLTRNSEVPEINFLRPIFFVGSVLIAMGLVTLSLMILGCLYVIVELRKNKIPPENKLIQKLSMFIILFIFNAVGVMFHTLKLPFFSFMKASYFLNSLPAFAIFMGLGAMYLEKWKYVRDILIVYYSIFFILIAIHILWISMSLQKYFSHFN